MHQSIILAIGAGRCGLASLARVLNQQPDAQCSYDEPPLLPWSLDEEFATECPPGVDDNGQRGPGRIIQQRFARFRRHGKAPRLGDAASFYLPYLEEAIAAEPDIRIVCLKRPREEVVASFSRWLDRSTPLPTNHWAREPADGWHHDPLRSRNFPKYDTVDREEGIGRYWDE